MAKPESISSGMMSCPVPLPHRQEITIGHGGGGTLTQDLLDTVFRPAFSNEALDAQHDGALLGVPPGSRLAFTTDSHVVSPLFFPGGDIGKLAGGNRVRPWGVGLTTAADALELPPWRGRCDWNPRTGCIIASGGVNITKNGRFENHRACSQKRRWPWRPPA